MLCSYLISLLDGRFLGYCHLTYATLIAITFIDEFPQHSSDHSRHDFYFTWFCIRLVSEFPVSLNDSLISFHLSRKTERGFAIQFNVKPLALTAVHPGSIKTDILNQ